MMSTIDAQARANAGKRVAALGEPWISYFHPQALVDEVAQLGFSTVRDLGPQEANTRYFRDRADGLRVTGSSRLMSARV
jgi:O-methyltransferase involved in polyketide biosynthesis